MINKSGIINDDYAWELCGIYMLRQFSDGVDFLTLKLNWDRYLADHTPRFEIGLIILNCNIFEFTIYYRHHRDS